MQRLLGRLSSIRSAADRRGIDRDSLGNIAVLLALVLVLLPGAWYFSRDAGRADRQVSAQPAPSPTPTIAMQPLGSNLGLGPGDFEDGGYQYNDCKGGLGSKCVVTTPPPGEQCQLTAFGLKFFDLYHFHLDSATPIHRVQINFCTPSPAVGGGDSYGLAIYSGVLDPCNWDAPSIGGCPGWARVKPCTMGWGMFIGDLPAGDYTLAVRILASQYPDGVPYSLNYGSSGGIEFVEELVCPADSEEEADWGAPWCGPQPPLNSIYDHDQPWTEIGVGSPAVKESPTEQAVLIMYDGTDKDTVGPDCHPQPGHSWGTTLRYTSHEGWDVAGAKNEQLCAEDPTEHVGMLGKERLVHAAFAGSVEYVGQWTSGYGLTVVVRDGDFVATYSHLVGVMVSEGDDVSKGEPIATTGNTGKGSQGLHLHWSGGKGSSADVTTVTFPVAPDRTFDVYGWNKSYGLGFDMPGIPDPARTIPRVPRKLLPGATGPPCPSSCGPEYRVADETATFVGDWQSVGTGVGGSHTVSDGGDGSNRAIYTCHACSADGGTYIVKAHFRAWTDANRTRAGYYIFGEDERFVRFDQGDWDNLYLEPIVLAVHTFTGRPQVTLTDDTAMRWDLTGTWEGNGEAVTADDLIFQQVDCSGGEATSTPGAPPTKTATPGANDPTPVDATDTPGP